jgi:SAM-dependent methyltransferase
MGAFRGLRKKLGLWHEPPPKYPRHPVYGDLRAGEALERFLLLDDAKTVIDVGSGTGEHARYMRAAGKNVFCISMIEPADFLGDYLYYKAPQKADGIWASHVLEHVTSTGVFLKKCFDDLREDGVLAVTVPPLKHNIVGGHMTLWNEGLLLYNLISAGFDCSEAQVGVYGYNISVIVRKKTARLPADLYRDEGDIEKLKDFFPIAVHAGIDGRFGNINWDIAKAATAMPA